MTTLWNCDEVSLSFEPGDAWPYVLSVGPKVHAIFDEDEMLALLNALLEHFTIPPTTSKAVNPIETEPTHWIL